MVNRILERKISDKINTGKAIILIGARQVGKTTLLEKIFSNNEDVLWLTGDSPDVISLFESPTAERLQLYFGNKKTIIIDEAQLIPEIGLRLKLITDYIKDVQLIATGSSSFELANRLNEPPTGRKWEYKLYPLSFAEMINHHGFLMEKRALNHRLVYGYYPDILNHPGEEKNILKLLVDSYLYKDILLLERIKKPDRIIKLLQALAYQIGNQVSYNELGQICGLDNKTTEKYITLLEQAYIIFRLGSFSRNLRNELKYSRKIYFYDNGVRNTLISNYTIAENRSDIGQLWENFLVAERLKKNSYDENWINSWYWRTTEQQEIDYIEEYEGRLHAYEFKWNNTASARIKKTFTRSYPNADFCVIYPDNVEKFLL
ncbi:MAG: ATP-binding protein [Bacteroidales bacterium]|nr:ATP-binding protein [Bacteroidales bacterium]